MRSALVLAGGYSTRFGDQDKATAELDGRPLIRRVAERLESCVDDVVVNCRHEQRDAVATALDGIEYRKAIDPVPDRGPVAGIRTGCRVARGRWTFVTACDMPFVRPELPNRLFETADDADGAVARIDGRPRPLAAVYRTASAVEAAETTLALGSGSVMDLLNQLSVQTVVDPVPVETVDDVDTLDDLETARLRSD